MTDDTPATPSPAVAAASKHLAHAEAHAADADCEAAHVEANVAVLRQRIASADSAKASIAARRQAGHHHPDDAGNLALVGLDREGLVALLAEAEVTGGPVAHRRRRRPPGRGARAAAPPARPGRSPGGRADCTRRQPGRTPGGDAGRARRSGTPDREGRRQASLAGML